MAEQYVSAVKAYHATMESSNAKYKVYLREHTYIINDDTVADLLGIFQTDETIERAMDYYMLDPEKEIRIIEMFDSIKALQTEILRLTEGGKAQGRSSQTSTRLNL